MDYLPDSVPDITEMISEAEDRLLLAVNWIAFHFLRSLISPTISFTIVFALKPMIFNYQQRMTKSIYIYICVCVFVCNFGWYLCILVTIYTRVFLKIEVSNLISASLFLCSTLKNIVICQIR